MKQKHVVRSTAAQWTIAAVCGVGVIVAGLVWADSPAPPAQGDLHIALTAQRVVRGDDGKEKLQPADRAFPGEIVQYDALYQNKGDKLIGNVEPTLPIPNGMAYVPDSAKPAPVKASLDGKTFEPLPIKRKVTLPNGEVEEREVPATEYRALRWFVGEVESGARTTVVARARILPTTR
jgi:uncharacterized repeat protein (TIGR01451 family)